MSYQLSKNILATITYYDVLRMPLTAFEVWRHLIVPDGEEGVSPAKFGDVRRALCSDTLTQKIRTKDGMYFLSGQEALLAERINAEKRSARKLRRLRRLAYVLSAVPYVRMIGATGSLSMKHSSAKSDWDVFVILRSGKIWIGRTLLTGFLHLLGKRRHGKKIRDRVCLNYFITDDALEIGTKDLFSSHEYRFLIPLFNFRLFQIFEIKNRWMRRFRPNFSLTTIPSLWTVPESAPVQNIRRSMERILDFFHLERWLSSWQKAKIARNEKTHLSGSLIETTDRTLIFLPAPRGPKIFQKFKERLGV